MRAQTIIASICSVALLSASFPVEAAQLARPGSSATEMTNIMVVEYRGNRHNRGYRYRGHKRKRYRRHGGRRHYRGYNGPRYGGYHGGYYGDGTALALGLLSLGIGLAIASSANNAYYRDYSQPVYRDPYQAYCPAPGTEAWHQHCEAKYRSYRRSTGTYTAYSGRSQPCRCP